MGGESGRLDYWRKYFRSANSDIFQVIENAILIAASDRPEEFHDRRCRIAEMLFATWTARCVGCDRVGLHVPEMGEAEEEEGGDEEGEFKGGGVDGGSSDGCGEKGSKVNSSITDDHGGGAVQMRSNFSYDEAEALTEEIEEESQMVGEVLRIKKILANHQDESDSVLYDSLRKLELMRLSVETLQATEIGKAVNGLRRHSSKQIRHLVRTLIYGWKDMVDEWVNTTNCLAETTPESMNPSCSDLDGLPLPPLDEGAFLATQTTNMELSQFFDGMDDDGNPRNIGEFNKNPENERKPTLENHYNPVRRKPGYPSNLSEDKGSMRREDALNKQAVIQETQNRQTRQQEPQNKQSMHQAAFNRPVRLQESLHKQPNSHSIDFGSGSVRPPRLSNQRALVNNKKSQDPALPSKVQKKPSNGPQDKLKSEENSVRARLEIAKRKLHERYQEAENAKKQRTIQVMELQDLPKQGLNNRQPFTKPGNHNRHWANGRR